MLREYHDDISCDLAEYYHVYEMKDLSPQKISLFIFGLRRESRLKMKLAKRKASDEELLLSIIADDLNLLVWSKTKDGQHNRHRPKSIFNALMNAEKKDEYREFESGLAFMKERENIMRGG